MVLYESEFLLHIKDIPSKLRYCKFLHDVAQTSNIQISPQTLRSEADIDKISKKLEYRYSAKSVKNYCSVMRHYVSMVETLNLH